MPGLPIQVQCEPPAPPTSRRSHELHDAGADAIGIHVESLDDDVRRALDAGQGDRAAVASTGRPGTRASASSARTPSRPTCSSASARTPTSWSPAPAELIDRGVYPFVVPYRPIPGTLAFADGDPAPDPELLADVTARVAKVLRAAGMRGADQAAGLRGLRRVLGAVRGGGLSVPCSMPRPPRVRTERRRRDPRRPRTPPSPGDVTIAEAPAIDARHPDVVAHRALRRAVFVDEQGLFPDDAAGDLDEHDARPAHDRAASPATAPATVVGGVRLAPVDPDAPPRPRLVDGQPPRRRPDGPPTGRRPGRRRAGAGRVRPRRGRRRAAVRGRRSRPRTRGCSRRLGWQRLRTRRSRAARTCGCAGRSAASPTSSPRPRPRSASCSPGWRARAGFVGDDGAPVPGSDLVAACDAILPAMVERDPEWAGWCGVLVNVNDLAAMGAAPVGLLDARRRPRRVVRPPRPRRPARRRRRLRGAGARRAHPARACPPRSPSPRWAAPPRPVPGGGGRAGHGGPADRRPRRRLAPGLHRSPVGLHVDARARRAARDGRGDRAGAPHRPAAAKDVSMAGVVGTLGMLAEASGPARCSTSRPCRARRRDRRRLADLLPRLRHAHRRRARRPPPVGGPGHERGVRGAHGPATGPAGVAPALARRRDHRGRRRGA